MERGGVVGVEDDRADALKKVSACRACISKRKAEKCTDLEICLSALLQLLNEDSLNRIDFVGDTTVH